MTEAEITKNRNRKNRNIEILDLLKTAYPDAGCALVHRNVFELIICVVLSAQTTDVSVNKVSGALFEAYPDAETMAEASAEDVIEIIKSIGMYKTKSKNIISLAKALCENFQGEVPDDYDSLVSLPGVGRKTANVVLAVGFGHQRIAVDTHVFRVARRIGLAGNCESVSKEEGDCGKTRRGGKSGAKPVSAKAAGAAEVLATEKELMEALPENRWSEAHHSLIWHGRKCCTARNPKCDLCPIEELCRKEGLQA